MSYKVFLLLYVVLRRVPVNCVKIKKSQSYPLPVDNSVDKHCIFEEKLCIFSVLWWKRYVFFVSKSICSPRNCIYKKREVQ